MCSDGHCVSDGHTDTFVSDGHVSDGHFFLHLKKRFHQLEKVYLCFDIARCKLFYFVGNGPRIPYMCLDLKSNNGKGVKKMAGHLGRTDRHTHKQIFI